MKNDFEQLKQDIFELGKTDNNRVIRTLRAYGLMSRLNAYEVLSQEWIDKNTVYADVKGSTEAFLNRDSVKNLLVPQQEEITEDQVMDWLDHSDFYDHLTAETVLERGYKVLKDTRKITIEEIYIEGPVMQLEWMEEEHVRVDIRTSCYGEAVVSRHIFPKSYWEEAKRKGYFMA